MRCRAERHNEEGETMTTYSDVNTKRCPKCDSTMHPSSAMENPFAGDDNPSPYWQCEMCGHVEEVSD